jgi:hypothetical protein
MDVIQRRRSNSVGIRAKPKPVVREIAAFGATAKCDAALVRRPSLELHVAHALAERRSIRKAAE